MSLSQKVKEYKAVNAQLAPKVARMNEILAKVDSHKATRDDYNEHYELCDEIRSLEFKAKDIAEEIANILAHSIVEEVAQGQPYKVEIGSGDLNDNYTLINKEGSATIIIMEE